MLIQGRQTVQIEGSSLSSRRLHFNVTKSSTISGADLFLSGVTTLPATVFGLLREAPKKILVRNLEEALGPYFKFEEALVPFSLFQLLGEMVHLSPS